MADYADSKQAIVPARRIRQSEVAGSADTRDFFLLHSINNIFLFRQSCTKSLVLENSVQKGDADREIMIREAEE